MVGALVAVNNGGDDDDDDDDDDDVNVEFCFSTLTSETTRSSETFAAHVCQRPGRTRKAAPRCGKCWNMFLRNSLKSAMPDRRKSTEGGTFAATMVKVHLDELLAFEEFWKNSRGGVKSLHSSSRALAALSAFAHSNLAFAHSSMHLCRQALAIGDLNNSCCCCIACVVEIHRLVPFFVQVRVLVLARARTANESACVVPPRQLLLVLHHVVQAVCDFACELLVETIWHVKKGGVLRSKTCTAAYPAP